MNWFESHVWNPLKTLVDKVIATGEADLKILAGQVAAQIPASPITTAAETAFETAIETALDGVITSVVGQVPVEGAVLSPAAVAAANEAIDYVVGKGDAGLNSLAAAAKAKLSAIAGAPAHDTAGVSTAT